MGDSECHEVGNPPEGLAGFNGLLELGAAALRDLGSTNRARPDRTARHEAMIESLAVGTALADIDICQTVTRYRGTENHALGSSGRREEAVYNGLDSPTTGAGCRRCLPQYFTGLEVHRRVGGRSFGNYTKAPPLTRLGVRRRWFLSAIS